MLKEIFKNRDNQVVFVLLILALALLVFGSVLLSRPNNGDGPVVVPNTIEEVVWEERVFDEYNFKLTSPEHFDLLVDNETYGPLFNLFDTREEIDEPLTHLDNASHVSIYPTGLPLGGVSFIFAEKEFTNDKGVEFILQEFRTNSGKVWGILATPKTTISGWKPWGFVWISSKVDDEGFVCVSGEEEKSPDLCNPFEGDQMIKSGEVDEDFVQLGREILNSFEVLVQ